MTSPAEPLPQTTDAPLHDLGRTAKEAARYLEAQSEAALDPKNLMNPGKLVP